VIEEFEKRFKQKTGVDWVDRNNFDDYVGRYTMDSKYINFYSVKSETGSEDEDFIEHDSNKKIEAKNILKNLCFEILVKKNKDENFIEENSTKLFDLIPKAFKKKIILNSEDSLINARITLNKYEKSFEKD